MKLRLTILFCNGHVKSWHFHASFRSNSRGVSCFFFIILLFANSGILFMLHDFSWNSYLCACLGRLAWGIFAYIPHFVRNSQNCLKSIVERRYTNIYCVSPVEFERLIVNENHVLTKLRTTDTKVQYLTSSISNHSTIETCNRSEPNFKAYLKLHEIFIHAGDMHLKRPLFPLVLVTENVVCYMLRNWVFLSRDLAHFIRKKHHIQWPKPPHLSTWCIIIILLPR